MMTTHRRPPRIAIAIVAIALVVGAAWWAWNSRVGTGASGSGALELSGTVEAEETQVSSVLAGRIDSATATEGARVAAGAALFQLDTTLLDLQVEQAVQGANAAKAAYDQAVDEDLSKAEVRAAKARWDQAKATASLAIAQRDYATVTAPATGVITVVTARVGENAAPGKTLATIANMDDLYVTVFVPETRIGSIHAGSVVDITGDSFDNGVAGEVSFIASESEFTPNNIETKDQRAKLVYEVRIRLTGAHDDLTPGMPVDVVFE